MLEAPSGLPAAPAPDTDATTEREETKMAMRTLEDCFQDELRDVLSAEKQLVKALPKMAKGAGSDELRAARAARAKKCDAMEGLLEEGEELLEEDAEEPVKDALIIAASQKVEHYEIATYGTLCTWAELLGFDTALKLLKQNLAEEKAADEKLTQIASKINLEALEPVEAEE
jgi:ferritin-like metal-binding protein YciE